MKTKDSIKSVCLGIFLLGLVYYLACFVNNSVSIKVEGGYNAGRFVIDAHKVHVVINDDLTLKVMGQDAVMEPYASKDELVLLELRYHSILSIFKPWFITQRDWFVYPDVYDCVKARMDRQHESERLNHEQVLTKMKQDREDLHDNWQCN